MWWGGGEGNHPFRSGLFSGLGGGELNKPKGLGHFSCDTPHGLSKGLGGGWGRLGVDVLVPRMEDSHHLVENGPNNAFKI